MRLPLLTLLFAALLPTPTPHWQPPQHLTFFWQLQGTPSIHDVAATDMDGFENSAATVARFHAAHQHVVCYIDAGTWEQWRPDAAQFPASLRGASNGWPGELWLDIRQLDILKPLMIARIRMCHDKGFDAVEPDNIEAFTNHTGFPITAADQLAFNKFLAEETHAEGMAIFLKNDGEQSVELEPFYDGVINEECHQFHECEPFQPFLTAHKPVLNIEYKPALYPAFCTPSNAAGMMSALFNKALNGELFKPCWPTN